MAFLVYRRRLENGEDVLEATGDHFKLAGYNLIHTAWVKQDRPTQQGWRVTADELIKLYSDGKESYDTLRFLIDYDPQSKDRIVLIELLEIYLYTWAGNPPYVAGWTPMMIRMRDVLEEWPEEPVTTEAKGKRIALINIPSYGEDFVEFLYLQGDDKGWNWGRNGATNAVFLHGEAREYFRQYF